MKKITQALECVCVCGENTVPRQNKVYEGDKNGAFTGVSAHMCRMAMLPATHVHMVIDFPYPEFTELFRSLFVVKFHFQHYNFFFFFLNNLTDTKFF